VFLLRRAPAVHLVGQLHPVARSTCRKDGFHCSTSRPKIK
jgi:hypothetical protein